MIKSSEIRNQNKYGKNENNNIKNTIVKPSSIIINQTLIDHANLTFYPQNQN